MSNNALSVATPDKKTGFGRTALTISRLAVVYYLVSLFFSVLNPLAINKGVVDYTLKQVFGNINDFTSKLSEGGLTDYYARSAMTAVAYVLLITMVGLSLMLVLSLFDGRPKKVAVIGMAVGFFATAVGCGVAGIFSFVTATGLPYAFVAALLFAVAGVFCLVSLKSKSCADLFAKEVDETRIGGKLTAYFAASVAETKKIVWPDRKTVIKNTVIVLLFIVLLGVVIWGLDALWGFLFSLLLGGKN